MFTMLESSVAINVDIDVITRINHFFEPVISKTKISSKQTYRRNMLTYKVEQSNLQILFYRWNFHFKIIVFNHFIIKIRIFLVKKQTANSF